jgi:CheY-like chemotaxis protein
MARILVVEDAPLQRTIIRRFLRPTHTIVGFTTEESEAVELAEEHDPDAVIMDLNLVEGDGIAAAERIRSHSPETGIVVSTALVDDDIEEMAREVPVEGYLVKPYSKGELLEAIENAIGTE